MYKGSKQIHEKFHWDNNIVQCKTNRCNNDVKFYPCIAAAGDIFIRLKDGIKEEVYKAGLDLECPVDLDELQEHIDELKLGSQF